MTNLIRVRTIWTSVGGAPYYSNHYFTDDGTSGTAQDAVNAVDTFWTAWSGNMSDQVAGVVEGEVAIINDVDGQLVGNYAVTGGFVIGSQSTAMLPLFTQGLLRWTTDTIVNGRRLRGRTFIPGTLEASNDVDGTPVAGWGAGLQAIGAALIADSGNELRVWSRTHGVSAPAVGAEGLSRWATLRSRRD